MVAIRSVLATTNRLVKLPLISVWYGDFKLPACPQDSMVYVVILWFMFNIAFQSLQQMATTFTFIDIFFCLANHIWSFYLDLKCFESELKIYELFQILML